MKEIKAEPYILLLNDIHVSKNTLTEFNQNWDEAMQICADRGISKIAIGGDLWQSRAAQTLSVLRAVKEAFHRADLAGINITVAEGNHCKVDQETTFGYSHVFDELPNIWAVDVFMSEALPSPLKQVDFHIMSYFPENGSFVEKLNSIPLDENVINILYIHQGINGGLSKPNEKDLSPSVFSKFDKVLVGHYHDRKQIKGTNIEYIGASRQHNFGEDEDKGYTILYTDGTTEFVQNQANKRYITFTAQISDIKTVISAAQSYIDNENYLVKIQITCSSSETTKIDKAALLEMGVNKVEINLNDLKPSAITSMSAEKFDKEGLTTEYRTFCGNKEIDAEMGVKYLDKIK